VSENEEVAEWLVRQPPVYRRVCRWTYIFRYAAVVEARREGDVVQQRVATASPCV